MINQTKSLIHRHRFEFRAALACLLASLGTMGLAVEGRVQDLAGDRQALAALYNATGGANWANNDNWLSDEPLSAWRGVSVSNGRVTWLSLSDNQLTEAIPENFTNLTLEHFYFYATPGLSVPDDAAFREWLDGIGEVRTRITPPLHPLFR